MARWGKVTPSAVLIPNRETLNAIESTEQNEGIVLKRQKRARDLPRIRPTSYVGKQNSDTLCQPKIYTDISAPLFR